MSRFRAALDAEIQKTRLPNEVSKVPKGAFDTFGTERESRVSRNAEAFGTFGTAQGRRVSGNEAPAPDPAELDERAAMALGGGVPAAYADAFSRLQLQRPAAIDEPTWRRAVDDAGRFLDAWGKLAEQFGWMPGDLFDGPGGLIWFLRGEAVRAIGPEHAVTTDGRVFDRLDRSFWASVAAWTAAHR